MPSGTIGDCDRDDDDSSGAQQQQQPKEESPQTAQDAQRRIHELESQVRFYKVQSTGAGEFLGRKVFKKNGVYGGLWVIRTLL